MTSHFSKYESNFGSFVPGDKISSLTYIDKEVKSNIANSLAYQGYIMFLLAGKLCFFKKKVTIFSKVSLEQGGQAIYLTFMSPNAWYYQGSSKLTKKDLPYFFKALKESVIRMTKFSALCKKFSLAEVLCDALQFPDKLSSELNEDERCELKRIVRNAYLLRTIALLATNYHLQDKRSEIRDSILSKTDELKFNDLFTNCYKLSECHIYFDTLDCMASNLNISADSLVRYESIIKFEFKNAFIQDRLFALTGTNLVKLVINNSDWLKENSGRVNPADAVQNPKLTEKAVAELIKEEKIYVYSLEKKKYLKISYEEYKEKVVNKELDPEKVYFSLERMNREQKQMLKIIANFKEHPNFISLPAEYVTEYAIPGYEKRTGIKLNGSQKKAIIKAFSDHAFCFIIGEAGSGKTTLIKAIVDIYKHVFGTWPKGIIQERLDQVDDKRLLSKAQVNQVAIMSLTGRAASVYEDTAKTKYNDRDYHFISYGTIHNVMHFGINSSTDPQKAIFMIGDLLIIDEASMVDLSLFHRILNYTSYGMKLVMVGDPNQVAPIHAGQIFYDLTQSKAFAKDVVKLDKVYRQNTESPTYKLIKDILAGEKADPNKFYNTDQVNYCNTKDLNRSLNYIKEEILNHRSDLKDVLVLAAKKVGKLGVDNLNRTIQALLQKQNPSKYSISTNSGLVFYDGDRVMQIKNDYDQSGDNEKAMNGQVGTICIRPHQNQNNGLAISTELPADVSVIFDDGTVKPIKSYLQLSRLLPGFAMTVHKAQGIGRKYVIVALSNLDKDGNTMWNKNLLYTAASRTKQNITFVGSLATYNKAVNIIDNTADKDFIQQLDERLKSDSNSESDENSIFGDNCNVSDDDLPF